MAKPQPSRTDLVERKAKRALADVVRILDPDRIGPQEATELARSIGESLARLPPEQAFLMHRRAGVAASELEALIEDLKGELSTLGDELKAVAAHSSAAAAYTRRAGIRQR